MLSLHVIDQPLRTQSLTATTSCCMMRNQGIHSEPMKGDLCQNTHIFYKTYEQNTYETHLALHVSW
jgi:hypothetical protein